MEMVKLLPFYSPDHYRKVQATADLLGGYVKERAQVCRIIEAVRSRGDGAVKEFTKLYDGVLPETLIVPEGEIEAALQEVEPSLLEALRGARDNIEAFHRRQLSESWWVSGGGRIVGQKVVPVRSAGAYAPGGTAAYPSSVLMTVVPARVAGVKEIYLCTPPDSTGSVNPLTLAAAREAGVTAVFRAGGVQAIAAMAYGTETIPAVDKIVGPGNLYVTLAKREVFGRVGIDMLAGPSEIVIVAGKEADPAFIAADLLSQAEHDPLARAILVTVSEELAQKVTGELERQLNNLPRREIAGQSIRKQGAAIVVSSLEEAWALVNEIAPEHLELHLPDPWRYLEFIENAGAVFLGPYTPEPLGDYWAGSNHVLPTAGAARYASPLGVSDFIKRMHILSYTPEALAEAAPQIEKLARAEGLEAHARSITARRRQDDAKSPD